MCQEFFLAWRLVETQHGWLHFLQGEAKLTLGDDMLEARPGSWVHMAKGVRHGKLDTIPVEQAGIPVYNVAMRLLQRTYPDRPPFRVVEIPVQRPAATA
jgi:hypothetical protein